MLRLLRLSLVATKSCHKVAKYVAKSFYINRRSFHINPSYRSNCDFGSPCDCTECTEAAKSTLCEICRVRSTTNQSSNLFHDRKGISGYTFTSFCNPCWEEHLEKERMKEREKEQTLTLYKNKVDKMMKHVRGLHSTEQEQVPIAYAVDRLLGDIRSVKYLGINSRRWYQRHLIVCLSQDLGIVKIRNRYMCNKRRVDAMDFKLWYFKDFKLWHFEP